MPRRSHLGEGGQLYQAFRSYVSARHEGVNQIWLTPFSFCNLFS